MRIQMLATFLTFALLDYGVGLLYSSAPGFGEVPEPPDYSEPVAWAALPDMADSADVVPSPQFRNRQDSARVDVFYLYPTTYTKGKKDGLWNAGLDWEKLNADTDERPIRHQATVFNGSARVFAPRYRQAHLSVFFRKTDKDIALAALDTAYTDVRNAFRYYLKHYNNGRPIIIAGHSQGTHHAKRLLEEFFDNKPLKQQLVVAYLVGMPVHRDTYASIKPCQSATDTICFCSWRSVAPTYNPGKRYFQEEGDIFNINPVTWTTDSTRSEPGDHMGLVKGKYYDQVIPQAVEARVGDAYLRVDITGKGVRGLLLSLIKNYHIADYNLFWVDFRRNVADRCQSYLNRQDNS